MADFKLFVKKATSSKSGKVYFCLVLKMGYRDALLSFDYNLCAEALRVSVPELFDLENGEYPVLL